MTFSGILPVGTQSFPSPGGTEGLRGPLCRVGGGRRGLLLVTVGCSLQHFCKVSHRSPRRYPGPCLGGPLSSAERAVLGQTHQPEGGGVHPGQGRGCACRNRGGFILPRDPGIQKVQQFDSLPTMPFGLPPCGQSSLWRDSVHGRLLSLSIFLQDSKT